MQRGLKLKIEVAKDGKTKYIAIKDVIKCINGCYKVVSTDGASQALNDYVEMGIPVRDAQKFIDAQSKVLKDYTKAIVAQFKNIE